MEEKANGPDHEKTQGQTGNGKDGSSWTRGRHESVLFISLAKHHKEQDYDAVNAARFTPADWWMNVESSFGNRRNQRRLASNANRS